MVWCGMADPQTQFDSRTFRNAVGSFATGVTIITARGAGDEPVGLTVNSFTSVSLEPPLVLFCLAKTAESLPAFTVGAHFAVNILSEAQQGLSNRFAKSGEAKYEGLEFSTWQSDAPILPQCACNLECEIKELLEGGDHLIVLGRVIALGTAPDARPLLFHAGRYAQLGSGT